MSFCILTFTMSAGVPTKPPAAPAMAAIATFAKKDSLFRFCFATS